MNYIVLDLEWNQSQIASEETKQKLPFEIIEIGAVKVGPGGNTLGMFHEVIKPQIYHEMHFIVGELVHIDQAELDRGNSFPKVAKDFLEWCGEDSIFCTWGTQDIVEFQKNMLYYGMPRLADKPFVYLDIQKLFAITYEERRTRRALEYAIDYLGIIKDEPLHRAYNDAYYTAKVFGYIQKKNPKAIENVSFDIFNPPRNREDEVKITFEDYSKYISRVFRDKREAFFDREVSSTKCYLCHKNLRKKLRWFSLNNKHYYSLAQCEEHGYIRYKIRMQKAIDGGVFVVKTSRMITEEEKDQLIKRKEHMSEMKKRRGH